MYASLIGVKLKTPDVGPSFATPSEAGIAPEAVPKPPEKWRGGDTCDFCGKRFYKPDPENYGWSFSRTAFWRARGEERDGVTACFCSYRCMRAGERLAVEWEQAHRRRKYPRLVCPVCGREFPKREQGQFYCSKSCEHMAKEANA